MYKLEDVEMQEADNDYVYEEDMNASAMKVDMDTL